MNDYKYILAPYGGKKSKYRCPRCNGKNELTRYVDLHNQCHVADNVGLCNNKNKCGYHYPPREYFKDTISQNRQSKKQEPKLSKINLKQFKKQENKISHYHKDLIIKYNFNFKENQFLAYFRKLLGSNEVDKWIELYNLGLMIKAT